VCIDEFDKMSDQVRDRMGVVAQIEGWQRCTEFAAVTTSAPICQFICTPAHWYACTQVMSLVIRRLVKCSR